jgi:hypothetical protein
MGKKRSMEDFDRRVRALSCLQTIVKTLATTKAVLIPLSRFFIFPPESAGYLSRGASSEY